MQPSEDSVIDETEATSAKDAEIGPAGVARLASGGAGPPAANTQVRYGVTDNPPWWQCVLLGMQTYLTMLGSTVLIPLLLVPAMGGDTEDTANVICTCFFASGINTTLQALLGARLPIVQGGSFAYISPVLAMAAQIKATQTFESDHERFLYTMRVLQGGIIGSALIALGMALLGIFYWLLKHLSPITIGVNISILGLSLYSAGWPVMGECIQLGLPVMVLIIVMAFHLRSVTIFGYAYIMTVAGVYDNSSAQTQASCTTNQSDILSVAPWIRFPYPGQWGAPIFTSSGVFTMMAAVIPAALESIGDYFAAARLGGAPRLPSEVVSRALAVESICCIVAGVLGTTSGSTAYAENVGAIAITGVASRRVVQIGAAIMIVVSLIAKFGALFASIPQAMVAGMFSVMFSLIAGVGFSNLEGVSLHSERNIFILGFGLYSGLSVPDYFTSYASANNGQGPIDSGSATIDSIFNSFFSTPAAVALMACLLLDLTIPSAPGERGQQAWQRQSLDGSGWWHDEEMLKVYGWPLGLTPRWRRLVDPYKEATWAAARRWLGKLRCGCCEQRGSGRRLKRKTSARTVGAASVAASDLPLAVLPPSAP